MQPAVMLDRIATRPSFRLSRFVEAVREIEADGRTKRVDRLPDGRTCLVFRKLEPDRGDIMVAGPRTRATLKDKAGMAITVQFKPGWSTPLLGVPAHALTNQYTLLEDLWGDGARELTSELVASKDAAECLDRIARAISAHIDPAMEPSSAPLARRAAALLAHESRVERVADQLGVTARHLRRVFAENIGVTPKDFARSARLQRAISMTAMTATEDWSQIATAAGYYDQAHLIADFRDLVGLTPNAYVKRVRSGRELERA